MHTLLLTSTLLAGRVRQSWSALGVAGDAEAAVLLAVVGLCRARVSRPELGDDWRNGLEHPAFPWQVAVPRRGEARWDEALSPILDPELDWASLPVHDLGVAREVLFKDTQRFVGTHYTPPALARRLVMPLLDAAASVGPVRVPTVVDPAAGAGALLLAIAERWLEVGHDPAEIAAALHGVDLDPLAIGLARMALYTRLGGFDWERRLRVGDALTGPPGPNPGAGLDWHAAFPDPMDQGGFEIVIANPPFGGERVRAALGRSLRACWPEVHGKADLAAYFVRRIATILRPGGHFGLIATNTLAQGHTRESGLGPLMEQGTITLGNVETDVPWPGQARVTVNLLIGTRGGWCAPRLRDGEAATWLASNLRDEPEPIRAVDLASHRGVCFEGVKVGAAGFLIEAERARSWIIADPSLMEVLRPYLGGAEITDHPTPTPTRYVIDLGAHPIDIARSRWPALIQHLERTVRPARARASEPVSGGAWWRFARPRPALNKAIQGLDRIVVSPRVARHLILVRLGLDGATPVPVCSEQLNVFLWADDARFGVLSSVVHEAWARRHASTLETRLRYTPTTCFMSFILPDADLLARSTVAAAALAFEVTRDTLAQDTGVGLTTLYNTLVGEPHRRLPPDRVRTFVQAKLDLDRAVIAAYGWDDLCPLAVTEPGSGGLWPAVVVDELVLRLRARSTSAATSG